MISRGSRISGNDAIPWLSISPAVGHNRVGFQTRLLPIVVIAPRDELATFGNLF